MTLRESISAFEIHWAIKLSFYDKNLAFVIGNWLLILREWWTQVLNIAHFDFANEWGLMGQHLDILGGHCCCLNASILMITKYCINGLMILLSVQILFCFNYSLNHLFDKVKLVKSCKAKLSGQEVSTHEDLGVILKNLRSLS